MTVQSNTITPLMALQAYPGSYECHITVCSDSEQTLKRFEAFCLQFDLKPLIIMLDSGHTPRHPMLSKVYHDKPEIAWKKIQKVIADLNSEGFQVDRLKLEAGFLNLNIPELDSEMKDLTEMHYFEFHVKLELPIDFDVQSLRKQVKQFQGHLSANSLWKNDKVQYHFITQRIKNLGKVNAEKQLNQLLTFLSQKELKLVKTVREFNIYDSNLSLDSGWF